MFWERVEPNLTPRLAAVVAKAYDVFSGYRLSGTIIHCDCPCCMTPEMAADLSHFQLEEISSALLAEYTNSAHGYDRDVIEHEFKHFLPRYFDLIARCDPPSHLGLETCLRRLDGYRGAWPKAEVEIVDEFFDAFVEASLSQLRLLKWPAGWRLAYDMGEVLGMVALAGGDFERVLAVFDSGPDPEVGVHIASMRRDVQTLEGGPYFENAHYDDVPEAARRLGAWLQRDCVTERIMAAHEVLQGSNYDDVLNLGI